MPWARCAFGNVLILHCFWSPAKRAWGDFHKKSRLPISGQWGIQEEGLKNWRLPKSNDIKSLYGVLLFQKKGLRSEFCGDCSWAQGAQCKLGWIIQFSVFNGCNKFDKIVWIGLKFDQTLTLIIALECSQAINAWKSMPHQSKLFCNAGFELLYSYCTPEVQTPKTTRHQKFVQMKSF